MGLAVSRLAWTPLALFGCDPTRPFDRLDRAGLLWLVEGRRIVALTAETAAIEISGGRRLTYRRKPHLDSEAIAVWDVASEREWARPISSSRGGGPVLLRRLSGLSGNQTWQLSQWLRPLAGEVDRCQATAWLLRFTSDRQLCCVARSPLATHQGGQSVASGSMAVPLASCLLRLVPLQRVPGVD